MKRTVLGILVVAFALFINLNSPCNAEEEVFNWKMQAWRSAGEPGMQSYVEFFEKTLPAMTNGRLKIKMYWGGELVATPDILDAVKTGVVEMGLASAYTYQGVIPVAAIEYGLPFGIRTPAEFYNFMYGGELPGIFGGWRAIDLLREEYAKQGVHLLISGVDGWPASFMFKSPIKSIDDIKGKKVRASGLMMDWIQMLGGDGVFITGEETYTALQTGALDGVSWGGAIAMYTLNFHEVVKNYLCPPLMPFNVANVIVNQRAWNSLPDDLKVILEKGLIVAALGHTNHQNWTGEQWGRDQMKKAGVSMNWLEGDDLKRAQEVAFKLWDKQSERSPASAKLIDMIKDYMKTMGYLE